MSAGIRPFLWTFLAVALSATTALFVARWSAHREHAHTHPHVRQSAAGGHGDAFHDWLHEKLEISPEQEEQLAPFEERYAHRRRELLDRITAGGLALSGALAASPLKREAVDAALAEIHAAQGELQKATITHFLEMKDHLSPGQAEKLVQWTRESITHEHPR